MLSIQPVAGAAEGDEGKGVAELAPELAHVDVDGALVAVPVVSPPGVEQLPARQGQPAVLGERLEERELAGREIDGCAADPGFPAGEVDLDRAGGDRGWTTVGRAGRCPRCGAGWRARATSSRGENGLVT